MRVGAALRPLDVPAGTPLGGYADRTAPAGGRLDELTVAAVAVEAGDGLFVLVVAELVCVNEDLVADVAAAVTARLDRTGVTVWTAATHTHSGPDVNCGTGDRVTPPQWRRAVAAGAADAAEEAARETHSGRLAWRGGVLHGVAAIRSVVDAEPAVPVDVLTVSEDDGLAGVLVVLPVHPTVLPAANTHVSGDLAGAVRRALADRLGGATPPPWVVVTAGCAGDVSTRTTRRDQMPAELIRLAELAADQLATIVASTPYQEADAERGVRAATARVRLPVKSDDPHLVAAPAGSPVAERIAHVLRQGEAVARERATRFPEGTVELAVSAADLGGVRLLALGAEPYLAIRELPAVPAVVLGYANGYAGYLPDAAGSGRATYESLSSPFRADAAEGAVRAAEALLDARPDREEPR